MGKSFSNQDAKKIAAYLLINKRTGDLNSMMRDVKKDWADNGIIDVVATSAFPISDRVKSEVKNEILKIYPSAKQIIITENIDESVIAGIKLELTDKVLDLSIENKLNKFKQLAVAGKD
jgi:F0F1-type ATP synthase delta subunit